MITTIQPILLNEWISIDLCYNSIKVSYQDLSLNIVDLLYNNSPSIPYICNDQGEEYLIVKDFLDLYGKKYSDNYVQEVKRKEKRNHIFKGNHDEIKIQVGKTYCFISTIIQTTIQQSINNVDKIKQLNEYNIVISIPLYFDYYQKRELVKLIQNIEKVKEVHVTAQPVVSLLYHELFNQTVSEMKMNKDLEKQRMRNMKVFENKFDEKYNLQDKTKHRNKKEIQTSNKQDEIRRSLYVDKQFDQNRTEKKKKNFVELEKNRKYLIIDYGENNLHLDIVHFCKQKGKYVIDIDQSNENELIYKRTIETLFANHLIQQLQNNEIELTFNDDYIEYYKTQDGRKTLELCCKQWKEELSENDVIEIHLPSDPTEEIDEEKLIEFTREQFEMIIQDHVETIGKEIKNFIEKSQISIDYILLTGGNTKIPLIRNKVESILENCKILNSDNDNDDVIFSRSQGNLYSLEYNNIYEENEMKRFDFSIGMKYNTSNDSIKEIIKKHSVIPYTYSFEGMITLKNEKFFEFILYNGLSNTSNDLNYISHSIIHFNENHLPKENEIIKFTIHFDNDQITIRMKLTQSIVHYEYSYTIENIEERIMKLK